MKPHRTPRLQHATLACAALLACAAAMAQPRTTLAVMPQGSLGGAAEAWGLNDLGILVGNHSMSGGASQPFFWVGMNLPAELLGVPGSALGVSNGVTVVGSAVFAGVGLRAFSWTRAGGLQDLGVLPGGSLSFATGVDDAGRITGISQTGSAGSHAFLLEPGGVMRDLGTLGGSTSQGQAIANGRVVGSSTDASGALQAFAWTEAGGMLGIGPVAAVSEARGVNRGGLVVGRAVVAGEDLPFLWTPGDRARLLAGAEGFYGAAVNDAGQVLLRNSAGGNSMLWVEGGTPAKLHTLAGAGVSNFDAVAINAYAQVAGTATGSATGGVARPVLLTLHPEWQGGSGRWDGVGGGHWNWAGTGVAAVTVGAMHDVVIDPAVDATVTVSTAAARSLRLGGRGTQAVVLDLGGSLTLGGPATVAAGGTLRGCCTLKAQSITIAERAEVQAPSAITLDGGNWGVSNAGTLSFGNPQYSGVLFRSDLPSGLTNLASGRVEVLNAALQYGGAISNAGVWKWTGNTLMTRDAGVGQQFTNQAGALMVFSAGRHESDALGGVNNLGRIEVGHGANWSLEMDLSSSGELDIAAGAVVEVKFPRTAWLAGATGQGRIELWGYLRPEVRQGTVRIEPTLAMRPSSRLMMALAGTTPGAGPGHHDKFIFDGAVELAGGTLMLQADASHAPQAGDVYDLFDWNGGLSGTFAAMSLPMLTGGLRWDSADLYAGGTLSVTAVPEPGAAWLLLAGLAGLCGRWRRCAVPAQDAR